MRMPIVHCKYDWLVNAGEVNKSDYSDGEDIPRMAIQMPEGTGDSWFTSLRLPLNVVVRRGVHHFKPEMNGRLFELWRCREEYSEPILSIQSARLGRVILYDNRIGEKFVFGPAGCLFQHADSLDNTPALDATEDVEFTNLIISDSTLGQLLGHEEARKLYEGLHMSLMPSTAVNRVPRHISGILYSCLDGDLFGNVRKLHAQAKVLEYICALATNVAKVPLDSPPVSGKEKAMRQLHEELLHLEGKVPTLDDLAGRYGVSARVLNDEYKRLFGQSVFVFVTELRLREAHEALSQTKVPMKILAANLGYSHVNHFISAFGKKFGYSPGSLRRNLNKVE